MNENSSAAFDASAAAVDDESGLNLGELIAALLSSWPLLLAGPLMAGGIALVVSGFIAPTYTASTTLMPPQQAQSGAASALASLGSLGTLAGGGGIRTAADQYVALLQSATVSDRIVERFKLMEVRGTKFRVDAREALAHSVRIGLGKKDGLITIEVDDTDPQRAADIANRYVDELRRVTANLALTEAQQRRVFFENQLKLSRDRLVQSQQALESSGFNPSTLKTDPKSTADTYARLKAEVTSAEVRLQVLRGSFKDGTPEILRQQDTLTALRDQLARAAQPGNNAAGPDYIGKYRDFKYQETLFELYARQLELARADESREGVLIQVVDPATPPERKSKPKRTQMATSTMLATALILACLVAVRHVVRVRKSAQRPPVPA